MAGTVAARWLAMTVGGVNAKGGWYNATLARLALLLPADCKTDLAVRLPVPRLAEKPPSCVWICRIVSLRLSNLPRIGFGALLQSRELTLRGRCLLVGAIRRDFARP